MAQQKKKSAFEQVLDSAKSAVQSAGNAVGNAWNSDYNVFAQKNLTPIMQSGANAIKWGGDRAGAVLNDVVQNPQKYSIFNALAEGQLTKPLGATGDQITQVAKTPAQFLDKTLFSAPRLFSNAYKTTEALGQKRYGDAASTGARTLYDALWFAPGIKGAPLTNNMLQNTAIWPAVDAVMGAGYAARKGENVLKGAVDNAVSTTPKGLGDAVTDNETWRNTLNLAQIVPVMVGSHYMGKYRPGDGTVINNLVDKADEATYSLKGLLGSKNNNKLFASLAQKGDEMSPVQVRELVSANNLGKSVLGKRLLQYADEAEKAGRNIVMALDNKVPQVKLVAPKIIEEAAQTVANQADNIAPQLDNVAPQQADNVASVKFMITNSDRQALADLGYSADDVAKMNPQQADALISNNTKKILDGIAPPPVDIELPKAPPVEESLVTGAKILAENNSPYVTPQVADAMAELKNGTKLAELAKNFDSGTLQEANQRIKGVGLLADLDAAFKAQNYSDVKTFAGQMIQDVAENGKASPYAEYIDGLKDYLKFVPDVNQAELSTQIDNALGGGMPKIPDAPAGKEVLGFIESSLDSPKVKEEVKESILKEGGRIFYDKAVNKDSVGRVNQLIQDNPEVMLQRALSGEKWTNNYDDIATNYLLLANKYAQEGNTEVARELTFKLSETANKYGQFNQALSMLNKLTPEGQLLYVQKTITKLTPEADRVAATGVANGIADQFNNINNGVVDDVVKKTVEKFGDKIVDANTNKSGETIQGAIKRIKGVLANKVPPEQKLANKINPGTEVKNVEADAVKDMVNTLYGVAKDTLPKKVIKKRDPMDFISLAMNEREKYGEVWDKAQQIVRNKYADNPVALEALDDYFAKVLDKPFSDRLVENAVRSGVRDLNLDLGDIVRQRQSVQKAAQKSLVDELMNRGWIINPSDASEVEGYLGNQFSKLTDTKKRQILESMLSSAKGKGQVPKETIDRVIELSNLGALDNQSYYEIVARKMKLPVMTDDMAQMIKSYMDKVQELDDTKLPGYITKNRLLREMYFKINQTIPRTWAEKLDDYRYRNMLLGPQTQLRNIVGNIGQTFVWRPANLAVQQVMDSIPSGRSKTNANVVQYYRDVFNSFGDAGDAFTDVMAGRAPVTDIGTFMDYRQDISPDFVGLMGRDKGGFLPNIGKFMEATDAYFSTMISAGEYTRLKAQGIDDIAAWKGAQKIAQDYLYRGQANPEETATLVKGIDKIASAVTRATSVKIGGIRPLSWFVPFTKIANNMTKQFIDYSPLGFANAAQTADDAIKAERMSRAVVGTSIMGLGSILAMNGKTTWSAPKDKTARDLFYAEKMKPYSVNIGGTWVPMTYFGPLAFALAVPAAIKQAWVDDPEADVNGMWEKGWKSAGNVFKFLGGQSYVSGIALLSDALSGNSDVDIGGALSNISTQLVPAAGLNRYINTIIDPYYKKSGDAVGQFIKSWPGGTFLLPAYETPDGDPESRDWFNALLPYEVGVPRGEYGQDYQDRIQELKDNAVEKREESLDTGEKTSTVDTILQKLGIKEAGAAEEKEGLFASLKAGKTGTNVQLPQNAGEPVMSMDGQPVQVLGLGDYLQQEAKNSKLLKAYLSGDSKRIERELDRAGMTPDEGMVAAIKSLNADNRAEFLYGEMNKEGFTPQMLNTLIDNKLLSKTEAEWMVRKGLITPEAHAGLLDAIENRESELGILSKKDPKYIASVLSKQPPKDDTEAMNLIKQSILTTDVINKMLMSGDISPEYGAHLKDILEAYQISVGVKKGKAGKKPKKADISLLKIQSKATPKISIGKGLKPRSLKTSGLTVKSAVPQKPAGGAVSNKLPAKTQYSFSNRIPLQVRNTMTTRLGGLGR